MNEQQVNNVREWEQSAIAPSLIALNLKILLEEEEEIAEWYFGELPRTARRNDGRIRDGYLKTYRDPLKGGWGIEGYDPTDLEAEPELRTFKPDRPRIDKDGKPIKYDFPKNARHNPILPRVSNAIASEIFRSSGVSFLELTKKYAPGELITGVDDDAECQWFWRAVLDHQTIPISLAEGGKKALSLLGQGRCAIAVTSITTWRGERGSNELHPWLALFAPKRHFYLTFDQDIKPKTIKAVNVQCWKLGNALIKAGSSKVKRISWSGTAKGIDDFIYGIQSKYGDRSVTKILRKCYQNARDYRKFTSEKRLPGQIKTVNKQYLQLNDLIEATKFKILIVKSAKGTNKTGLLSELVERDRALRIPSINLSYLERLARELGERLDLPYRTEEGTVSLRNSLGYSLCIDSFSPHNSVPFHPEQWTDAGLAMDEFTQVCQHLARGTTEIKNYRPLITATLGQKLADCWTYNKPIYLLDADANIETIELIYELIQLYCDEPISREELEANTLTLINEYEPSKGDLHFYHEKSPKQIKADLIERMKNGENLLILSSSQKASSADGTINLEKLALKHYKASEVLRIDSTTTGDPSHPAFNLTAEQLIGLIKQVCSTDSLPKTVVKQLNLFAQEKEPPVTVKNYSETRIKVIIASPTICTGISIYGLAGYFDAVFSFQSGNITPNSVRQQLLRLRDFQVPRYLWCPKVGKAFIGSKSTNPIELLTDQKGEAKLSLNLLGIRAAEQLIGSNVCPVTKYWAKVGAKCNRNNYFYREVLLLDLEEEGWNIIESYPHDNSQLQAVWQERKQIKNSSVKEENNAIAEAPELTPEQAKRLQKRKDLTKLQQQQLIKHHLAQKYSLEKVTPELIEADAKKLYSALQLRFWLTLGRQFLKSRDRARLNSLCQSNHGSFFIPDFNLQVYITKVKLLELLKLERFSQQGTEWSNQSPELLELREFVFLDLIRFNQVLGCGIAATDSPITVLQKIQKKVGKRLPCLRNERSGEKRLRIYGAAESRFGLDSVETEIFESWLRSSQQQFSASAA